MGFSGLSIQRKLFLVLGSGILGFLIYFGVTYYLFQSNRIALESVVNRHLPSVQFANAIITSISRLRTAATQAVLSQNFDGIGEMDDLAKRIQSSFNDWIEIKSAGGARVQKARGSFDENYAKLNETLQNVVAGLETVSKVQSELQSRFSALTEVEMEVAQIKEAVQNDLNQAVEDAKSSGQRALVVGLGMLCMALILAIIAFVVMYKIIASLVDNNRTLQNTSKRLLEMVEEAQVSSSQLQSTANRQASSSTETVVSMEEMKRLLAQTSRASGDAVDMSEASVVEANNGQGLIQGLKDAMSQIERSNTELEEVNTVVKLIRDKTTVINEIVFKTQLLSFNANIEAARAGQHGLGFAVVATEMGSLADLSGKAAQEINDLLDQSADKVAVTISRTKDKIGNANDISAKCFDFFRVLTDRSGQLKSMVSSISSAAAEQNTGVEYVVNAMNELNQTASETDKMARGISMLADALKAHALTLTATVESLNGLIRGGGPSSFDVSSDSVSEDIQDPDLKLSA